uniref:Uncharacterized protein n=1 Tax=Sipha flava TaxID=143950 RepID=A0A2S2PV12_9HEMI
MIAVRPLSVITFVVYISRTCILFVSLNFFIRSKHHAGVLQSILHVSLVPILKRAHIKSSTTKSADVSFFFFFRPLRNPFVFLFPLRVSNVPTCSTWSARRRAFPSHLSSRTTRKTIIIVITIIILIIIINIIVLKIRGGGDTLEADTRCLLYSRRRRRWRRFFFHV